MKSLHPATRLVVIGLIPSLVPLFLTSTIAHGVLFCAIVLLAVCLRTPLRSLRAVLPALIPMLFVAMSWLSAGIDYSGHAFRLGPLTFHFTEGTLRSLGNVVLRTLIWIISLLLVIRSLTATELETALRFFRIPGPIILGMSLALRYWTYVRRDVHTVVNAQRARGVNFSWRSRLWLTQFSSLILAATMAMLNRFRTLNYALVIRGFGQPVASYGQSEPMRIPDGLATLGALSAGFSLIASEALLR